MHQPRPLRLEENRFAGDGLGSLFHHPDYFRLHSGGLGVYFEGFDGDRLMLVVHLCPQPDAPRHWRSPLKGTYAGYAVAPGLSLQAWQQAHASIEQRLAALGARSLELLLAPAAHQPAQSARQAWLLLSQGWQVARTDLNFAMAVDGRDFSARVDADHRRRLRLARTAGVTAVLAPHSELASVHGVIAAGYRAKGRDVSMTLQEVARMCDLFARQLVLVACHARGQLVGGAIALQLDAQVLYLYAWSALAGHAGANAPAVMAQCLYAHCQARGLTLLDGGTATVGAALDAGLAGFKRSLGMTESLKLRMTKSLPLAD